MKTVFEELGGTYSRQGDYILPNVSMPEQPKADLGAYAAIRKRYLIQHHKGVYIDMLTKLELIGHLADVERRAMALEESIIENLAEEEGVTEQLKEEDMMAWVRHMNSIRQRAREMVLSEIVYV